MVFKYGLSGIADKGKTDMTREFQSNLFNLNLSEGVK